MIEDPQLFPDSVTAVYSPRLLWLKEHNLARGNLPNGTAFVVSEDCVTTGSTHEECELKMATLLEVKHYSVTEFEKATAAVVKVEEDWQ